jgi:hypothetical protein
MVVMSGGMPQAFIQKGQIILSVLFYCLIKFVDFGCSKKFKPNTLVVVITMHRALSTEHYHKTKFFFLNSHHAGDRYRKRK